MGCCGEPPDCSPGDRTLSNMLVGEYKDDIYKHYELVRTLGEGSYGKVYLMKNIKTGQQRAVKQISKSRISLAQLKQLYEQFRILKQLDHPHIVTVYQLYDTKLAMFIVTELLEGGELFQYILKKNSLAEQQACAAIKSALQAINYCHLNGIVHRDIKPENLLLKEPNDIKQIKLVDFGCSVGNNGMLDQLIGTPFYLAPEVINKSYNQKCDIWSCGVILYILLTGKPPFFGKDLKEIKQSILAHKYDKQALVKAGLSESAIALCTSMLTFEYRSRPSAKQCLAHVWFKSLEKDVKEQRVPIKSVIEGIRVFNKSSKLSKLIQMYMYFKYNNQNSLALQQTFKAIDKNGDGKLSKLQIEQAIQQQGLSNQLSVLLYSPQGEKLINYSEFMAACSNKRKLLCKDRIDQTFSLIDTDRSGKISIKELKGAIGGANVKELESMLVGIDQNSDGQISLEEWRKMLKKSLD